MRGLAVIATASLACSIVSCLVMNGLVADQGDGGTRKPSGDDDTEGDAATGPSGDGSTPSTGTCDVNAAFTQFSPLTELNTADDEELPRLTRDELTVYYFAFLDGGFAASRVAERPLLGSTFGTPKRIFQGSDNARALFPTANPLRLYYADGNDGLGLELAERPTPKDPFTPSRTVLAAGTLETFSYPATFDGPSGSTGMFFVKWTYKSAQDEEGTSDLWQGDVDGAGNLGNPRALAVVNTPDAELDPTPSTDGLTLYYYSEHGLPPGQGRVLVTTRPSIDADFGPPRTVSEIAVPAGGWVSPSFLSPDRCRLYFYQASTADGNADIFVATRLP